MSTEPITDSFRIRPKNGLRKPQKFMAPSHYFLTQQDPALQYLTWQTHQNFIFHLPKIQSQITWIRKFLEFLLYKSAIMFGARTRPWIYRTLALDSCNPITNQSYDFLNIFPLESNHQNWNVLNYSCMMILFHTFCYIPMLALPYLRNKYRKMR